MQTKAKVIIGSCVFLALSGLVWIVVFVLLEVMMPPTDTKEWNDLRDSFRVTIEEVVPPLDGETYLYFYSLDPWDVKKDGNLITDKRVVSYYYLNGVTYIDESPYTTINAVTMVGGKNYFDDAVISLGHLLPMDDFDVVFAPNRSYHKKILTYIQSKITVTNLPIATPAGPQTPQLEATEEHLQGL